MKTKSAPDSSDASRNITERIVDLGDWRGETLGWVRTLIHEVEPDVVEEWKWRGTPVWSHNGGLFTGEAYKEVVKLTFFRGAELPDPKHVFNSSLEGNVRRAVDMREDDKPSEAALKELFRAAVAANAKAKGAKAKKSVKSAEADAAVEDDDAHSAPKEAAPKKAAAKKAASTKAAAKKAAPKKSAAKKAGPKKAASKKTAKKK